MKFKNHPLFLITILALFFPIGLIFLVLSGQPIKRNILFATIGLILFSILLSLAFLNKPKSIDTSDFQVYATRNELSLGQSGGLIVMSGNSVLTDYSIETTSDILEFNGNVYTAKKCGKEEISIEFKGKERFILISVTDLNATNETVFLSPTAKRYHKTQSHAGKNSVSMLEEDAIHSGKTPCLICYKE